jgi:diguanylate cyclase (GGDEF)-like protein/PAS domain S-box-containing protein
VQEVVHDITARAHTEEALLQSEILLKTTVENAPVVLTMLDRDGIVLLSAGAGLDKIHSSGEMLVGRSIFDLCKDNPVILENVGRALAGETVRYATEVAGVAFESSVHPVLDSNGKVRAVVGISADVTERKAAEEALRVSYAEVRRLHLANLKALSAALSVKDHYTLGHAARVAAYMVLLGRELGWPEERLVEVQDVAYLHDIGKIAVADRVLLKVGPLNDQEWELMRQHPVISAEIIGPLFDEELVRGVRHHHEYFDGSGYPDGLSGETVPLIARAMCVVDSYDAMSCVRPYSPARSYQRCQEELRSRSGTQYDPGVVEAFLRVLVRLEDRRRPLSVLAEQAATLIDPEQHKLLRSRADEARPEYREMVAALRALRDSRPDVHFITTFAQVGKTCIAVLDTGETETESSHVGDQWLPDDELIKVLAGERPEMNVLDADEFGVWITGIAPIRDASGAVTAAVCVDVPALEAPMLQRFHTDLSRSLSSVLQAASLRWSRAELEAITDGLTGLYNHRYLQERLDEELERARRQNSSVTVLFVDLDEFKTYNDACGHIHGDEALRRTAHTIERSIRHVDLAGRYGGDEFLVVLVGAPLTEGVRVAERVRAQVAALYEGRRPAVTVSIGVATFPADAESKNELLDKADWALYEAKRSGRNRVVAFSDGMSREEVRPHTRRPDATYVSTTATATAR